MQKLLTATLLLAGCALHQASAQKAATLPPVATRAATAPAPTLHWAAAEFCEAYTHYYSELPSLYKYNAAQTLLHTPLANPQGDLTALLMQQQDLREAVYRTIYQYCHTLKYGMNDKRELEDLVYLLLYKDLHMSELAATHLTPEIMTHHQQPAPLPLAGLNEQGEGSLPATQPPSNRLYGQRGSTSKTNAVTSRGLELSGWYSDGLSAESLDNTAGFIRFKIKVDSKGFVESVTKVEGNVSAAQEKLCRATLLDAQFHRLTAEDGPATGYYTFRFTAH